MDLIGASGSGSSGWPVVEGRYRTGNPDSPIAVCTMATMEMDLPLEKIAIAGKCVTENQGIEKIIKNTIANPKIRYMILCGQVSKGHFVGQAIRSLVENGVDAEKRIIGATGAMPVLKNVTSEEIEIFRKQITPINMDGEEDVTKISQKIDELLAGNNTQAAKEPEPVAVPKETSLPKPEDEFSPGGMEIVVEPSSKWEQDPKGFFTISVSSFNREIVAEHHANDGRILKVFRGKNAQDMYKKIIEKGLVTSLQHAAYLGSELAKAETALRAGINYEEDTALDLGSKMTKVKETVKTGETYEMEYAYLKAGKYVPLPSKDHNETVKVGKEEMSFRDFLKSRGLSRVF